jgi:hypothetical protein
MGEGEAKKILPTIFTTALKLTSKVMRLVYEF